VSDARSLPLPHAFRHPGLAGSLTVGAAAILVLAAIVVGRVSTVGLIAIGVVFALLVAVASLRWPRTSIVIVILAPILDRYILAGWLPPNVEQLAHFLSEGLLLAVGGALSIQAWRQGRLLPAIRHPVTGFLLAFAAISVLSALVNAVPPLIALAGMAFTLDACACFYLPRLVGFTTRHSLIAVGVFAGLVFISALGGLGQWVLRPDFLGLLAWHGRYGEVWRLASIYSDPNTFGALLIAVIPLAAFGITALRRRGYRIGAFVLTILLFMPLYLSFSRGAWAGLIVGGGLALAIISWRTLLVTIAIGLLSFVFAVRAPREILLPPIVPATPVASGAPAASPAASSAASTRPQQPSLVDSTIARIGEIWAGKDLRTLFVLNGLPIVADHPLLGVGPGRWGGAAADVFDSPVYDEYDTGELIAGSPQQRTVDNFWLHTLVETGIPGLMAFVGAGVVAGIQILRAARAALGWRRVLLGGIAGGTAAMAANTLTTMLLEANAVAFFVWFLLGLGSLVAARMEAERRGDVEPEALPAP
jgi:O-antigen ligase